MDYYYVKRADGQGEGEEEEEEEEEKGAEGRCSS